MFSLSTVRPDAAHPLVAVERLRPEQGGGESARAALLPGPRAGLQGQAHQGEQLARGVILPFPTPSPRIAGQKRGKLRL